MRGDKSEEGKRQAQRNAEIGRERKRQTISALKLNYPAPARKLVEWGIIQKPAKARELLRQLVKRGEIYRCGSAFLLHVPELMYSAVLFPFNQLQHHTEVMNAVDAIKPDEVISGEELEYNADRIFILKGERHYVERERGKKKSTKEVRERAECYRGCTGKILWILDTEPERKRYLHALTGYPERHFVGLYDQILSDPRGQVWDSTPEAALGTSLDAGDPTASG